MNCPKDHSKLTPKKFKQHQIHYCTCCKGLWLSNDIILSLLSSSVNGHIRDLQYARETSLSCPNHCANLQETRINRILIDVCSTCGGVWFDRGEIETVLKKSKGFNNRESSDAVLSTAFDGVAWFVPDLLEALFESLFDGV